MYWACLQSVGLLLFLSLPAEAFLPHDLSNWQNEYVCDSAVRLVRPLTVSDVEEAVKRHARVKAVGTGYTWNRFFCAPSPEDTPEDDTSANIVLTTIRPLTIDVNEEEMSVWVSAGVIVWDLMDYLGNYNTPCAPRGYALGSNSQNVNQTIAGAIATATHGTSLTYGSLSQQVIGFRVILANGTTTEIYPDNYPLYFKAFQVSVGRLGVVIDVKMRIVKEALFRRTIWPVVSGQKAMGLIRGAQEMYKSTGVLPDWLDGSIFGWNSVNSTFTIITAEQVDVRSEEESNQAGDDDVIEGPQEYLESLLQNKINSPINLGCTEHGLDVADGVSWEEPASFPPDPFLADANSAAAVTTAAQELLLFRGNVTLDMHLAIITSFVPDVLEDRMLLRDEYEVSVPVEKMADCIEGAIGLLESQRPETGLRSVTGFRWVGKETGLLSASNDQPRMWFGTQDYVYYHQGRQSNVPYKNLIGYLVTSPSCAPARLHWGKPGWPDPGCWNGAEYYPDTWCDFGCVVRDLDPGNKFISAMPEVWNWEGADLDRCCTPDGYDKSLIGCDCAVIRQRRPEECPPPPFYTDR